MICDYGSAEGTLRSILCVPWFPFVMCMPCVLPLSGAGFYSFSCSVVKPLLFFMFFFGRGFLFGYRLVSLRLS